MDAGPRPRGLLHRCSDRSEPRSVGTRWVFSARCLGRKPETRNRHGRRRFHRPWKRPRFPGRWPPDAVPDRRVGERSRKRCARRRHGGRAWADGGRRRDTPTMVGTGRPKPCLASAWLPSVLAAAARSRNPPRGEAAGYAGAPGARVMRGVRSRANPAEAGSPATAIEAVPAADDRPPRPIGSSSSRPLALGWCLGRAASSPTASEQRSRRRT